MTEINGTPEPAEPSRAPDAVTGGVPGFQKALAERVKGELGWRKLAAEIDISNSTLRGWLHEQRLISEKNLRTLLEAKGLAEEEIQRWAQLRELAQPQLGLATPADADGTVPGAENASRHDAGRRKAAIRLTLLQGAALAAALIAVGLGTGWLIWSPSKSGTGATSGTTTSGTPTSGAAAGQPTSGANCRKVEVDLRPGSVRTRIADTGGRGARIWDQPSRSCQAGVLSQGDFVQVVCMVLDGEPVDEEVGGRPITTTAWAKMSSGAYVLSIYTDLPFTDGSTPVPGLSAC
ncbi:hypothetical protein ADK67_27700 [Saccharothrix sp. NRRL B-16348]|uniref:helix-turn-helix transcriptional regulator n=1 Tax=Saccharothrix sp. NRRL B-16348 TaxID=1415542 RepID=UPI0006AF6C08|nr:helix-turn-helix transcriptional regulator [Saccharothrix sp. NRRL B-16348]KOX21236.1 hypothetical protein ADK67_27700 [Saccharothrix sp. NRRL B-16348]